MTGHLGGITLEIADALTAETAKLKDKAESRITVIESHCCLLVMILKHPLKKAHNSGLQLRRAISIQAKGTRLLEKYAIAPSAARLCSIAAARF
jgi:hypothetical protein